MYVYHPGVRRGYDMVSRADLIGYRAGDVVLSGEQYLLCLGDQLSFGENYQTQWSVYGVPALVMPGFFAQTTIALIHGMVDLFFSSYDHVLPLYLHVGLDEFDQYAKKHADTVASHEAEMSGEKITGVQSLTIYPDLLMMYRQTGGCDPAHGVYITAGSTSLQKLRIRDQIHRGDSVHLHTTMTEMFQDWRGLQTVTVRDSDSPLYHYGRDPRFSLSDVLTLWESIYMCTIHKRS